MSGKGWRWIWQPEQGEGAEYFTFRPVPGGYEARGQVIAMLDKAPLDATYMVDISTAWLTRRVRVEVQGGAQLDVLSDGAGIWRHADGRALPALDGCIDTDILVTPFTNTLPIRRLGLKVGEAAEIKVAYVTVPALTLHAAPQRYTRLAETRWRFEGIETGFTAELTVDAEGFVVEYPGLFQRTDA
jgi:hypothetical protein